ncbi:MAG: right-handed parallel beta-helix repeat-containing protein [Verrucomicrobiota bacterium]|jgi:hypothetical protein|nr:right-handed parallel beta-helix repeat-containing protein [Verrucomicrobiota bacterium]
MKSVQWMMWIVVCTLFGAGSASATTYYINDAYDPVLDVYTTVAGNDANAGTSPNAPMATFDSLFQAHALQPGDTVYIDTGTYGALTLPARLSGTKENSIGFHGSTNGTFLQGGSNVRLLRLAQNNYLRFIQLRLHGGSQGISMSDAVGCEFEWVWSVGASQYGINLDGRSVSNSFRHCVSMMERGDAAVRTYGTALRDNYLEFSLIKAPANTRLFSLRPNDFSNFVGCVVWGGGQMFYGNEFIPRQMENCVFWDAQFQWPSTLSELQDTQEAWRHNTWAQPLFADEAGLDFHLLSPAGYLSNGVWVTNSALPYSPGIDFGPAGRPTGDEPAPNGGRLNVGLYTGTEQASKSGTSPWLFALTHNDGGTLVQQGRLEWVAGNFPTGGTVHIQVSTNRGLVWQAVATDLPASAEFYTWTPTVAFEHPAVLWRVVSATDASVASTNAKPFGVRTSSSTGFSYYVNDGSLARDVYCRAIGNDTNDGLTPDAPKQSLEAVLGAYQLKGGDTVYIDTGSYLASSTPSVFGFEAEVSDQFISFLGSTNGTVLNRGNASTNVLTLSFVNKVVLENLTFTGGNYGLYCSDSTNVIGRNLVFTGNRTGVGVLGRSSSVRFENCIAEENGHGFQTSPTSTFQESNEWTRGIFWNNATGITLNATSSSLRVSSSILGGDGPSGTLFSRQVPVGDYNVVWAGTIGGGHPTFTELQNVEGWTNSLYGDPLFVAPETGDYHLQSTVGRYDSTTGEFVQDEAHSPAIDIGDLTSMLYTNEPAPNGSRLNAGIYGGTGEASKSRTDPWLQVMNYLDGGTLDVAAGGWLRWTAGNLPAESRVAIWLSRDGGRTWEAQPLAEVDAAVGAFFYQNASSDDPSSLYARWKITLVEDPDVVSASEVNFIYKNGSYHFYINDAYDPEADVYTTAAGNDQNLGVSPAAPMATLTNLLATYQLGPGDRIYIDTGTYAIPVAARLSASHSGSITNPVQILGSTNRVAGGTVFGRPSGTVPALGFSFQSGSSNILLKDIVLTNVQTGIMITNALHITLDGVEVRGARQYAFDLRGNAREIQVFRSVVNGGMVGFYLHQITNVVIQHSVVFNAMTSVWVGTQAGFTLANSILSSEAGGGTLFSLEAITFRSDYNGIHAGENTRVAHHRTTGETADNLKAWNSLSQGEDEHSVPGNPEMADPGRFDYHLKTEQTLGRYVSGKQWTSDPLSSPLLEAGRTENTLSGGPCINIGRYGGTAEESRALETPWLRAVSLADAGSVQNGVVPLRWIAGGGLSNELVRVDVSLDGGQTWPVSVATVPATNGVVEWTVAGVQDTPAAVWRVMCVARTNIQSKTETFFAIRNKPLKVYVATSDTNETVYVSAPGRTNNWMATSNRPLSSLRTALERYDLEGGDQIFVDSGVYEESQPIVLGLKNSGTSNNPVRISGNFIWPYQASILKQTYRSIGTYGMQIAHAQHVVFDSLVLSNAWTLLSIQDSAEITLSRMRLSDAVTNVVYADQNARLTLQNSIVERSLSSGLHAYTGSVVRVYNSLLRDNMRYNIHLQGGRVDVRNSILEASGSQRYVYYRNSTVSRLESDYNNIRVSNGANVAGGFGEGIARFLIDWQAASSWSNDMSSFGYAADYADEGAYDFHLKSEFGRYSSGQHAFVMDETTSRLIDLGDRSFAYDVETNPNGGRINVGLYGNTLEASRSSANGQTLIPLTLSDGGTIRGEAKLYWSYGNGIPANALVDVQVSYDGGATWTNIVRNIYADTGGSGLIWDTTSIPSTAMGMWRVILAGNTNIIGQTETLFAVKNEPVSYYVNDSSTDGDVYCHTAGSPTHTGLSPDSPLNSLETLLGRYKVEHGDTVYVDTGIYPRSSPLVLHIPSYNATNMLIIQGSTNEAAGGSIFTNSSGTVLELYDSRNVELRNVNLHGGSTGLLLSQSSSNQFYHVRSIGAQVNAFSLSTLSDQNHFIQCAALNFSRTGFYSASSMANPRIYTTNYWEGGVMSSSFATSNGTAVSTGMHVNVKSGRMYVSNSVFVVNGPAHDIYDVAEGTIQGDYNCYDLPYRQSLLARISLDTIFGVNLVSMRDVAHWSERTGNDVNSYALDPLFADLASGDLHLLSTAGRFDPRTQSFVSDAQTSPLVDAAPPGMAWEEETVPNGARANLGTYGNHAEASRTPTNAAFVLKTLNRGGSVSGTTVLRWNVRGAATSRTYRANLALSTNSGNSWLTIAAGITAADGEYEWNTAAAPSGVNMRWRIQSQTQADVQTVSEMDFVIRNAPFRYYVNDSSMEGDVYCTVIGASTNSGIRPDQPLPSLEDVVERYRLQGGDVVYMDAGVYSNIRPVSLTFEHSGTKENPVVIQGSTNPVHRTQWIHAGLHLSNVRGMNVRDIHFHTPSAAANVVELRNVEDVLLMGIDVWGSRYSGIHVEAASNTVIRNFSVALAATNGVASLGSFNTSLESGVVLSNAVQVLVRNQLVSGYNTNRTVSYVTVTNCSFMASGFRRPIYELRGNLYADYNNYHLENNALVAVSYLSDFVREYNSVGNWSQGMQQDTHSLSYNPDFVDAAAGNFHLKSAAGNFDPQWGHFVSNETSTTSALIDAGAPMFPFDQEPADNGGRINIGRYGNTAEASKTPTNGSITLISFNDGGKASGTNIWVSWVARGSAWSGTVTISYSPDGGTTWVQLATGIPASGGRWEWDTTLVAQTVQGKLKVEASDGSATISEGVFSVRNAPFRFYINDTSIEGDMYCRVAGNNSFTGLSPDQPMADLNALLAKYDLEGGDTVFIDTGVYVGVEPWRITQAASAGEIFGEPVVFQGAVNRMPGGTVVDGRNRQVGIQMEYAVGVTLRNITVSNTMGSAVLVNQSHGVNLEWMTARLGHTGFTSVGGSHLRISNSQVINSERGVSIESWDAATNTVFPVLANMVVWRATDTAISISGNNKATIQNSILSVSPGKYVYTLTEADSLTADYNSIWLPDGGRVYKKILQPVPVIYETVGAWAAASGQDVHSYDGNPLLMDSERYDFHLLSQAGRHLPDGGWVEDAVSSPLIDAGAPASGGWEEEASPNGGRVNIGLYGGSPWASKSPTNTALRLLTLNRGGVASGQIQLNWLAIGMAKEHTVRVEISTDDGRTWSVVETNVPASLEGFEWNSTRLPVSSPVSRWRITDEIEPSIVAMSEQPFVLHNAAILYYVNDDETAHDMYCFAPGSSANDGLSPSTPKRWISEIIDTYNLEPGDIVYVDTGMYQTDISTAIGDLDSGEATFDAGRMVTIVGSTNSAAGGTRYILSDPARSGFILTNAYGIHLKNMTVMGANRGLELVESYYNHAEGLVFQEGEDGVHSRTSSELMLSHSVMSGNRNAGVNFFNEGNLFINSSVMWSNRLGVFMNAGYAYISNSIVAAVTSNSFGYYLRADRPKTDIFGDYNNLFVKKIAAVAGYQSGDGLGARTSVYASVSSWTAMSGEDGHSLAHDPLLADPGRGDFHLRSPSGRYSPALGAWVVGDTATSPLIDAGDPASMEAMKEPSPNGRRLNIGLYGGTPEASKTSSRGWVTLLSLNDGGSASGEIELKWTVGGIATNYSVCIQYSPDDGITWQDIICGVPATQGSYLWDSAAYGRSALGRWRVQCDDITINAVSQEPFVLRNGGSIYYYVNDASVINSVYCTAPGNDMNDGLTPATPKASLQAILDGYELAPEDVVLVDAGTYISSLPIQITPADSGWSNLYVTIQGSTNPAAPTIFEGTARTLHPAVFHLNYAENIRFKDMVIRKALIGVEATFALGCTFENVRIEGNNSFGMNLYLSSDFQLKNTIFRDNISRTGGVAIAMSQSHIQVENSVLWDSPTAVILAQDSRIGVSNSVLSASGVSGRIYTYDLSANSRTFIGDFNNYYRQNNALLAEQKMETGGSDFYNNLPSWTSLHGGDRHSSVQDPLFADPVSGDFHLRSEAGRYVGGVWTNDVNTSPLLDAGAFDTSYELEPAPRGIAVNIGAYGNTPQASKSKTNEWVNVISPNEATTVSEALLLYWTYGGLNRTTPVELQYTTDYGWNWTTIARDIPVGSREYEWDVRSLPLTLALNWRVRLQNNTNVVSASTNSMAIKTRNYDYYVNDDSLAGDVYCTAPGQPWNQGVGLAPTNPLNSLSELLVHYPVGAGDRIFIDTGTYLLSASTTNALTDQHMGYEGMPLQLIGSTNWAAGGALFEGRGVLDNGLVLQNTRHVHISNLRFTSMNNGVLLENTDEIVLSNIEAFANQAHGISVISSGALFVENSLLWENGGYGYRSVAHKGRQEIVQTTIWDNGQGAVYNEINMLEVSNSILGTHNARAVYTEAGTGRIQGNYNLYTIGDEALLATNAYLRVGYGDLRQWQEAGRDGQSWIGEPLFVDAAAGDFHLKSRAGYKKNGEWRTAGETSWAIDAGDPLRAAYTNEPAPHGGRVNLGRSGGTSEASKSDASMAELLAVSLRDGGVAPDGQELYWLARGLNPTNTVCLEYSSNNGETWASIECGRRIGETPYTWFSSGSPSPQALWRVVLAGDESVKDESLVPFIYRPTPLKYYVNDASRERDVYTGAIGLPTNLGYESNSPLDSVQAVFERYQLLGGDTVYIDTGTYELTNSIFLSALTSGDATNRIRVVGSHRHETWFQAHEEMREPAVVVYGASHVELEFLHLQGFTNGVAILERSSHTYLDQMDVLDSWGPGIRVDQSWDIHFENVVIRNGSTNGIVLDSGSRLGMQGCVMWSNRASAVYIGTGSTVEMSNSVVEASGFGNYCYESPTNVVLRADYNNLFLRHSAQIASINRTQYDRLPQWVQAMKQDRNSLGADPLFHDPANGDFHPRSVAGRYQTDMGWVQDISEPGIPNYSPLIDMGAPQEAWTNEPAPNGGRRNIGPFGNTIQASKSNTNAWLVAVTAMSGGILEKGVNLVWGYGGNISSNDTVRLEYSYDNATANWVVITETKVGNRQYYWQSDLVQAMREIWPSSPAGRWRITLVNNTNVWDMTDVHFGLRNQPFTYYVNDDHLDGDIYATAIGDDANLGFYSAAPKRTLQALLEEVDLEPTDRVLVDTGVYYLGNTNAPILWEISDSGARGEPVEVRGSSNGSLFVASNRFAAGYIFRSDAESMDMSDIQFAGGNVIFRGTDLVISNLVVTNGSLELLGTDSTFSQFRVDRGAVLLSGRNNWLERMEQRWGSMTIRGTNVSLLNSVVYTTNTSGTGVWVNAVSAVLSNNTIVASAGTAVTKTGAGITYLGHNILVAGGGPTNSVIMWRDGVLRSDWNNLWARDQAWVGTLDDRWEKLVYWQNASDQDRNSIAADPLFLDERAGDFHLQSKMGYWSTLHGDWQTSSLHSPAIDTGNPSVGAGNETVPNGWRRNLGAYGGTEQASRSLTNFWLQAIAYNDGGVAKGTNVVLTWAAGNAEQKTVSIEYSPDGGLTWITIATGVDASAGRYVWDSTGMLQDSFQALWRVIAVENGRVVEGKNDTPFNLRNHVANFYVNDDSLAGDVYCAAVGNNLNSGLSNHAPKASLQAILDEYDLEAGDVVYVDAGTYSTDEDIQMIWSRSGEPDQPILIQGSTNYFDTVLVRSGNTNAPATGMDIKASNIELRHLVLQGGYRGVLLETNQNVRIKDSLFRGTTIGITALASEGAWVQNSAFWNNQYGVDLRYAFESTLENLTFALPTMASISMVATTGDRFQNNIHIPAENAAAYWVAGATSLLANAEMDYNLYDFSKPNTWFADGAPNTFRRWQLTVNNDFRSALTNANLYEVEVGNVDFHPLSEYGRWTKNGWVVDSVTSWAVDHGNPYEAYAEESQDNGARRNIGMYGNSWQASKGSVHIGYALRTLDEDNIYLQASDPLWPLIWEAHLIPPGTEALVQFSNDPNQENWFTLAQLDACAEYFIWNIADERFLTENGRWRIITVGDSNLVAESRYDMNITLEPLGIAVAPHLVNGLVRFKWVGALGGKHYVISYSDDFGESWQRWEPKYNGPAPIHRSDFFLLEGAAECWFEDRTSYPALQRWYRVEQFDE